MPGKTVVHGQTPGCTEGHTASMEHIQQKWPELFAFLVHGTPVQRPAPVKMGALNPLVGKYMNPDGSLKFQDLIGAPDKELQLGVKTLTPEQKASLRARLMAFQPSFAHRIGAGAMGIDIEGQRSRFNKLLA